MGTIGLMSGPPTSWCTVESDLGSFIIGGTAHHVTTVLLPDRGTVALTTRSVTSPVREAARQLEEYLDGRRRSFALALEVAGTTFQRAVWHAVSRIPWGETRSYANIADAIGRPASARPVGQAVGRNPLPIIWPCHRVVASDGIGGYGGGIDLKVALLRLEGAPISSVPGEPGEDSTRRALA